MCKEGSRQGSIGKCERSKRIEGIQRNKNPFVREACVEVGKW